MKLIESRSTIRPLQSYIVTNKNLQFLVSLWNRMLCTNNSLWKCCMLHLRIFFDPLYKSSQCWVMALKKRLQTKMPTFNCVCVCCSCNAPCPRFIMIPRFNGKDGCAVIFITFWSSSASDIDVFEVGEQLSHLVMIWHVIS